MGHICGQADFAINICFDFSLVARVQRVSPDVSSFDQNDIRGYEFQIIWPLSFRVIGRRRTAEISAHVCEASRFSKKQSGTLTYALRRRKGASLPNLAIILGNCVDGIDISLKIVEKSGNFKHIRLEG